MKAVTSSIGFLTLVAFGGLLVPPCFSSETPYKQLDTFLSKSTLSEELFDNVFKTLNLIGNKHEFFLRTPEFRVLAEAFGYLTYHEDHPSYLCTQTVLESLHCLINAALEDDKTLTGPHKDANRLNPLLRKLKDNVRIHCHNHLQSDWDKSNEFERNLYLASKDATIEFSYLNNNVPFDVLIRRIIYLSKLPKDTTGEDEREFDEIIVKAFYECYDRRGLRGNPENENSPLIPLKLTQGQVAEYLNKYFTEPCKLLVGSWFDKRFLTPIFEVLALEFIDFPGEQKLPGLEPKFQIDPLPAYVICRELALRLKDPKKHRYLIGHILNG